MAVTNVLFSSHASVVFRQVRFGSVSPSYIRFLVISHSEKISDKLIHLLLTFSLRAVIAFKGSQFSRQA